MSLYRIKKIPLFPQPPHEAVRSVGAGVLGLVLNMFLSFSCCSRVILWLCLLWGIAMFVFYFPIFDATPEWSDSNRRTLAWHMSPKIHLPSLPRSGPDDSAFRSRCYLFIYLAIAVWFSSFTVCFTALEMVAQFRFWLDHAIPNIPIVSSPRLVDSHTAIFKASRFLDFRFFAPEWCESSRRTLAWLLSPKIHLPLLSRSGPDKFRVFLLSCGA